MAARKVDQLLTPYQDQLGKVPDHLIAQKAGVSRSVVVTYRKKLGIAAYEGYKFGSPSNPPPASVKKAARAAAAAPPPPPAPVVKRKPGRPRKNPVPDTVAAPTPPAPKPAPPAAAAPKAKAFHGRRSKLDPYRDLLGKVADAEIAAKAGVTQENVRTYRARRGIPAPVEGRSAPVAAVKPAPAVAKAPSAPPAPAAKAAPAPAAAAQAAPARPRAAFVVTVDTDKGTRSYALEAGDIAEAARTAVARIQARHAGAAIRGIQLVAEMI